MMSILFGKYAMIQTQQIKLCLKLKALNLELKKKKSIES